MQKVISRKIIYLGLALCVIASMLAFACAEPEPETPTTPATEKPTTPTTEKPTTPEKETPQYGGILTIIDQGSPQSNLGCPFLAMPRWNPTLPSAAIESLVHKDASGRMIPWLASSWAWSDDLETFTLTLQEGVKFHDGTDFNAEAVKYNLDKFRTSSRTEFKSVSSIDVIDDYTLRLNMDEYDYLLVNGDLSAVGGAVISPTYHMEHGDEWCITNPVGTGPFKFVSFERDVSLKYERFDDYWQEGKPYLDGLEYDFIVDPVTAKAAFMAGEGQVLSGITSLDASELQERSDFQVDWVPGRSLALIGDSAHPDSPFADLRVRQAVSYAIDGEAIADAIGYGFLKSYNQVVTPDMWAYDPDTVGYPYDPVKAKELLEKAGYPNGFKTTISFPSYPDLPTFMQAVQPQLLDAGIDAELDSVTESKLNDMINGGWENQLVLHYFFIGLDPLHEIRRGISDYGVKWVSALHPEDYMATIDEAMNTADQKKVEELTRKVNRLMIDEYCILTPIFVLPSISAKTTKVHDTGIAKGLDNWTPQDAWLSK